MSNLSSRLHGGGIRGARIIGATDEIGPKTAGDGPRSLPLREPVERTGEGQLAVSLSNGGERVVGTKAVCPPLRRRFSDRLKVHMHYVHVTILSLLGLYHRKLTYLHQGREQRLTDIGGDNDLAARLVRGWGRRIGCGVSTTFSRL